MRSRMPGGLYRHGIGAVLREMRGVWIGSKNLYAVAEDAAGFMLTLNIPDGVPCCFRRRRPDSRTMTSGTRVLDPFCGSGTTLVETQRAGLATVGINLNPIACLLSRVKTAPLPSNFNSVVEEVVGRAKAVKTMPPSGISNVDHWFKRDVQLAVAGLAQTIACDEYVPWLDLLRLALSSILVRVSNQDSDTRYAAVEKNVARGRFFMLCSRSLQTAKGIGK